MQLVLLIDCLIIMLFKGQAVVPICLMTVNFWICCVLNVVI